MSTISINWLDKIKSEILITFFRSTMSITLNRIRMLPPQAEKKLQCWIRSRHLICSGNFYIFETIDYSAIERFTESITALGGTLISVQPIDKIWMGDHRQVILYRAKASLHTPCHNLKQYWFKYGSFQTRFDPSS
ncbi:CpeR family transcriptional regulator [Lyngbya sp. CCAP 1446/10]|uniref:CpeR family transcriptional regulator n=3 Tax=Microcoleaceae TaxID=1892252 RepID=UPI0022386952|nr:CpeR family transcriptional regulator [Lyngbya sp. CCAP 1446/10]